MSTQQDNGKIVGLRFNFSILISKSEKNFSDYLDKDLINDHKSSVYVALVKDLIRTKENLW